MKGSPALPVNRFHSRDAPTEKSPAGAGLCSSRRDCSGSPSIASRGARPPWSPGRSCPHSGRPTAAGRPRHDPVPERGRRRRPGFRPPAFADAGEALPRERAGRRRGVRLQRRRPARHLLHQRRRAAVAPQDRAGSTPTACIATTAACSSPTSPARPASAASATRWAPRPPTTTTTAMSTSSSRVSIAISCCATAATAGSKT